MGPRLTHSVSHTERKSLPQLCAAGFVFFVNRQSGASRPPFSTPPKQRLHTDRLPAPQLLKFRCGHGLCKIIPLGIVTAHRPKPLNLLLCLYALGHHAEMQPVCHADHIAQNALVIRLCDFALNELHIQLQNAQRHLAEHIQRGVPAAEIVHLHNKAQTAQLHYRADELAGLFRIDALCDLKMQILRENAFAVISSTVLLCDSISSDKLHYIWSDCAKTVHSLSFAQHHFKEAFSKTDIRKQQ